MQYDEKLKSELSDANRKHEASLEEVNKETAKLKEALKALENKVYVDNSFSLILNSFLLFLLWCLCNRLERLV